MQQSILETEVGPRILRGLNSEAGPSRGRGRSDKERDADEVRAKIELDEGLRKGKGKAREEVVVEKSNVLMV